MSRSSIHSMLASVVLAATTFPVIADAQGCEPIRFTAPVNLGAEGEAYQSPNEWRMTLAYRRLLSNEWYIGTKRADGLAPGGSSPIFSIHTGVVDIAYGLNARLRARVSIPFSSGSFSRRWADGQVHAQKANGIGDISLQAESWLLDPQTHEQGNIAVGVGIKAPTGSYRKPGVFYLGSGPVAYTADHTIQPGDGGWALLTQLQAFRRLGEWSSLYAHGSYMVSPKDKIDILGAPAPAPNSTLHWSVPDVYSVRGGLALNILPIGGLAVSVGARLDGIPVKDLLGGGDNNTIKRTSRIVFAEPGISYSRGKDNVTLSLPWRVRVNRVKSLTEQQPGALPNAGGFARYLVFLSYSRRL